MIVYKEAEVRKMVQAKLTENLNEFYKVPILNYKGKTEGKYYTEVIADELIRNYDQVSKIGKNTPIRSTKSFNRERKGLTGVKRRKDKFGELTYNEKYLAVALYNSKQNYCLGIIFDYEVPLKEKQTDKFGRIDLVSTDARNHSIKLIELKIKPNDEKGETLLRAILEIYTYYKLIANSYDKFIEDYKDYDLLSNKYRGFQPAILTDELALSGHTLLNIGEHRRIQALLSKMNNEIGNKIEGFVYDYPARNKSFQFNQSNGEIQQKILLEGNITIRQII